MQVNAGVTHVDGEPAPSTALQRSSARYLHRPDADYVSYDPLRTSMTGAKLVASSNASNAAHWLWQVGTELATPEFETNDLGRLTVSDGVIGEAEIEYRETVPGRWWRQYSFSWPHATTGTMAGELQRSEFEPSVRHHVAELLADRTER